MEWMLPWFIGLGSLALIAAMALMTSGGVPPAIQVLGVVALAVFAGLVARANEVTKEAPAVERIR